jgi:peptide/nickel transport system permease protein
MKQYLSKRIFSSILAITGLFVMVFFLARLTGDPGHLYLPIDAPLEVRKEFSEKHGFNDPIYIQFGKFLGDLTDGNLGYSLRKERPAIDIVLEAIPVTLSLAAVAMSIAFVGAILIGSLAAYRPNGIFIFSGSLGWLPTSGIGGVPYWIMPIGILAIRPLGLLVQVVRGSMITALSSDFVKTARAKGVKEKVVIFKHALRNALLPVITVAGDQAAAIANGAVIVETIFGWPGIGKLMIDSIMQRDFAVVQASILITAIVILSINIIIDIAYAVLDPRIRHK